MKDEIKRWSRYIHLHNVTLAQKALTVNVAFHPLSCIACLSVIYLKLKYLYNGVYDDYEAFSYTIQYAL